MRQGMRQIILAIVLALAVVAGQAWAKKPIKEPPPPNAPEVKSVAWIDANGTVMGTWYSTAAVFPYIALDIDGESYFLVVIQSEISAAGQYLFFDGAGCTGNMYVSPPGKVSFGTSLGIASAGNILYGADPFATPTLVGVRSHSYCRGDGVCGCWVWDWADLPVVPPIVLKDFNVYTPPFKLSVSY